MLHTSCVALLITTPTSFYYMLNEESVRIISAAGYDMSLSLRNPDMVCEVAIKTELDFTIWVSVFSKKGK